MSFRGDVTAFRVKLGRLVPAVHAGIVARMHESIRGTGTPDPLTGAPGQPVDTGFLRNSWQTRFEGDTGIISTNAAYARGIEDGISASGTPIRFKSKVGGAHSVKLTVAGASRIQAEVVKTLGGTP